MIWRNAVQVRVISTELLRGVSAGESEWETQTESP